MRSRSAIGGLVLSLCAAAAAAQSPPARTMRLIGSAPAAADPAPRTFVIDAVVKPGDGDLQTTIDGWLASTAAPATSGEVSGTCIERRCVISADLDGSKFDLTGDFGEATGPVAGRFVFKPDEGKTNQEGAATLQPLTGPVAGSGPLAAPDAVTEAELDQLLVWAHETVSSGSPPGDDPPSSAQRESLAVWQQEKGRLATGLIFAADLAQLKADADAARKAAGWTPLGDAAHGWSAGYPAALLPKTASATGEQRFTSADGKAVLVVAVDAPMTSDDFDAYVDKISNGRSQLDLSRVNGDMQMRYVDGGVVTVAAYHNRDGGLARLVFTYPSDRDEVFGPFGAIEQHSLQVTDDLKR